MDDLAVMQVQDTANLGLKRAFANVAFNQTDTIIIAAIPQVRFRVVGLIIQAGASATTITFNSKGGGAGTAISMTFQNASNGGALPSFMAPGWFETNVGEGLSVTTSLTGSTTGIQVVYAEIRDFTA